MCSRQGLREGRWLLLCSSKNASNAAYGTLPRWARNSKARGLIALRHASAWSNALSGTMSVLLSNNTSAPATWSCNTPCVAKSSGARNTCPQSTTVITSPTSIMSLKSRKSGSIFCGLASPVVSKIKVSVGIAALRRSMPGRKLSDSEQHTQPSSSASTQVSVPRSVASRATCPNSFWMTPV